MVISFLLLLCGAVGAANGVMQAGKSRIFYGSPAVKHWPFMVSFQRWQEHNCGAVLIRPDVVLTAAHCLYNKTDVLRKDVPQDIVLGTKDLPQYFPGVFHERIKIVAAKMHPNSRVPSPSGGRDSDIAVLLLEHPANVSTQGSISPVPTLPEPNEPLPDTKTRCQIMGWGYVNNQKSLPKSLHHAGVQIIPREVCNSPAHYNGTVSETAFCAGKQLEVDTSQSVDTCVGDSGGPLICLVERHTILYGIVAKGRGCGDAKYPTIYTDVSKFMKWIELTILDLRKSWAENKERAY